MTNTNGMRSTAFTSVHLIDTNSILGAISLTLLHKPYRHIFIRLTDINFSYTVWVFCCVLHSYIPAKPTLLKDLHTLSDVSRQALTWEKNTWNENY
jgi:hypothetical protein